MEADWEMEIGGGAPVIDAYWPGFVNLRDEPWRVNEIAETQELPGLAEALIRLNGLKSPVWTCKTDVFEPGGVDPDEFSATKEDGKSAVACYIDLLMRTDQVWDSPVKAEQACRQICARLHEIPMQCCRVDMVIRKAVAGDTNDLGATIYLAGCGPALKDARVRLAECLGAFAGVIATDLVTG